LTYLKSIRSGERGGRNSPSLLEGTNKRHKKRGKGKKKKKKKSQKKKNKKQNKPEETDT